MAMRALVVLLGVGALGPGAVARAETIQVGPSLTAGQNVASATLFAPGHAYKVTITGSVEAQRKDGGDHVVLSAFHCLSCPTHSQSDHLAIADAASGQALGFGNLNKKRDYSAFTTYNEHGAYVLTLDDFQEPRRLAWSASPFGVNPDSNARFYSGEGFKVVIADVTPKPCTAPRPTVPAAPSVSWVVLQGGPPTRHPDELTDTISVTRGAASLGARSVGPSTDSWPLRDPVGTLCHTDRFELTGHATRETHLTVTYRAFKAGVIKHRARVRYTSIYFGLRVTESDDPTCAVGTTGFMRLVDGPGKDAMALEFGDACLSHKHDYNRGLKVAITVHD